MKSHICIKFKLSPNLSAQLKEKSRFFFHSKPHSKIQRSQFRDEGHLGLHFMPLAAQLRILLTYFVENTIHSDVAQCVTRVIETSW